MGSEPWEDETARPLELSPSGATSVAMAPGSLMSPAKAGLPVILRWLPTARKALAVGQKMSRAKAG